MLQLLVDGMKDSPDYYLYKRRHVIELALSYHDSQVSDQHSQVWLRHVAVLENCVKEEESVDKVQSWTGFLTIAGFRLAMANGIRIVSNVPINIRPSKRNLSLIEPC